VTWENIGFWRGQLGPRRLLGLLAELAADLEVPPALVPWPALLVAGRPRAEVVTAAGRWLDGKHLGPLEPPAVVEIADAEDGLATAMQTLLSLESESGVRKGSVPAQPVHVLPSGRRVGYWSSAPVEPRDTERWCAAPVPGERGAWLVRTTDGQTLRVPEVVSSVQVEAHPENVVRLPGWLSLAARPATPAGLLIERLLTVCRRSGVTLWVPNVDAGLLRHLLRLGGEVWVDGPTVPGVGEG
jgi:hypothetical protein